jgi:hypothetical protein
MIHKKKALILIAILLLTILLSIVIGSTFKFAQETYIAESQSGGTIAYATVTPSPSPSPSPFPTPVASQHYVNFTYDKIVTVIADTMLTFRGPRPLIETVSVPVTVISNFNITFYARNFTLPITATFNNYDRYYNYTYQNVLQVGLFSYTANYNNQIINDTTPINVIAGQQTTFTLTFDFYNYYAYLDGQISLGILNLNNLQYYEVIYNDFSYNIVQKNT